MNNYQSACNKVTAIISCLQCLYLPCHALYSAYLTDCKAFTEAWLDASCIHITRPPPSSHVSAIKTLAASYFVGPQEKMKSLGRAAAESEEAKQVQEMFAYIKADVEGFKTRQWTAWCDQVSQNSESQLKKQLLV